MNFSKQISQRWKYFWGSLFYLSYAPNAMIYSRKRDAIEKAFPPIATGEPFDYPGKLVVAEATVHGSKFYFEKAELEITFLTADLVRINWQPGVLLIPYGISRHDWQEIATKLERANDNWVLSSEAIKIIVGVNGSLKFCDRSGNIIREEMPPQRKSDGWIHQSPLKKEEHIYGLGERSFPLNLRDPKDGRQQVTYRMWNFDAAGKYSPGSDPMYICIPLYLGLHQQGSYLIFYENSFEANFTFGDVATADFDGGSLRYYITFGSIPQLLERYTELTGRSSLPPRWALGYHQSHWGYGNEQAVREEAKNFQKYHLPLSAIHLDIDAQVNNRAFTIDPERYPNLPGFIKELDELGVRFIAILNPGIKYSRQSNLFLEGQILEGFCRLPNGKLVVAPVWPGWCVFPDFTNPKVRKWWTRQYKYLLDIGVAGFWHDMNEPAAFILWGDRSLPKATQHYMEGRGGDHREAHNVYGLLQARAAHQSLREETADRRPFIVSRAGWAGLQRYAWTWTGDVECTWAAMRITISTVVGLGLSGIPYSGPDIGGFQGNPSAELYLRWFQMATFFTFYRTHSSNNVSHRAPWTYGEPYLSIIREYLKLRYRLMPYFYTLAWEASQKGYPPVRPLFWCDTDDVRLWGMDDAFLLGNALLVCPVFEEGTRERLVFLPKGHWYLFWNNALVEGGKQLNFPATLEEMPLFVRAGTVLPMEDEKQLILHLYAPIQGDGEGYLYGDAGDGYGESRLDKFRMVKFEDGFDLIWEKHGDFPFSYQSVKVCLHGLKAQQAWIDGEPIVLVDNCLECGIFEKIYFQTSMQM